MSDPVQPVGASRLTRRGLVVGAGAFAALAGPMAGTSQASPKNRAKNKPRWPLDFAHRPVPRQAPARRGVLAVDGAELAYWDTGGHGPTVVFMHARSGSINSWPYQQPELVRRGYRVVGYSRRGHEGSSHTSVGYGADDLLALLDRLHIDRAHLVGHAAGGLWALDFALTHAHRLRSLTLACTTFGINDADLVRVTTDLRPAGFEEMPPEFRELGPSYRSADPKGVAKWLEIERRALNGKFFYQGFRSGMDYATTERLKTPVLFLTTDADMYMTPPLAHEVAGHFPNTTEATIIGSGHCPHWERPDEFNAELTHFFGRNNRRKSR